MRFAAPVPVCLALARSLAHTQARTQPRTLVFGANSQKRLEQRNANYMQTALTEWWQNAVRVAPPYPAERFAGRGIVFCSGHRYVQQLEATLLLLRDFGCTLPTEVWHMDELTPLECGALQTRHPNMHCRNLFDYVNRTDELLCVRSLVRCATLVMCVFVCLSIYFSWHFLAARRCRCVCAAIPGRQTWKRRAAFTSSRSL